MSIDAPVSMPGGRPRRVAWWLVAIVFVGIMGTIATTTVWRQYHWLTLAGPNTVGEAGKVYFANRFVKGQTIFTTAEDPPHYASAHGALTHASVGLIAKTFDLSVTQMYYAGRAISVAATLIALWLIGSILARLGVSRWWLAAVITAFFGSEVMTQHATSYRPDHWNLCLSVVCCYLLVAQPRGRWRLAALAVIPAVAFFIKAPGLALAIAVGLGLLAERKPKAAAVCVIVPVALTGAAVAVINWLSDGQLMAGLRGGMQMPISATAFWNLIAQPRFWLVWTLPLLLAERGLPMRDEAGRRWCVVSVFLYVELAAAMVAAMRAGSSTYYFVGSWLYGITLCTVWVVQTMKERNYSISQPAAPGMVLMFTLLSATNIMQITLESFPLRWETPVNVAIRQTWTFGGEREEMAERINRLNLICYSDDPGLNVMLDKPQIIYPLVTALMVKADSMEMEQLIAPVREHRYDVMVMTERPWVYMDVPNLPQPFLEAVEQYYMPVEERVRYKVYVPRKAED